jgi:hypothetical protein
MKLALFITDLLDNGNITIEGGFAPIDDIDQETAGELLQQFYQKDILDMPFTAPAFDKDAAVWAAVYLYTSIGLAVNREADEKMIKEQLKAYKGTITPATVYSADLVLRQLLPLLHLVKGLAPADLLLQELVQTAAAWPFSSVGYELDTLMNEEIIFSHPSLNVAYTDRIIAAKDKGRAGSAIIKENILAVAGNHLEKIWPGAELINNE